MSKILSGIAVTFLMLVSLTSTAGDIEDILQQADQLRTSAPNESAQLLSTLAIENLNDKQKSEFQFLTAFSLLMKGDNQTAINQLEILASQTTFPDIKARALSSLLNTYSGLHEWEKAFITLETLHTTLTVLSDKGINDYAVLATVSFYNNIEEFDSASHFAQQLIENSTQHRTRCSAMNKKLYADLSLAKEGLADSDFLKAINFCQSLGENVLAQAIITNLAQFYINNNQPQLAQKLLLENIEAVKNLNFNSLTSYFLSLLVQAYDNDGKVEVATTYAENIVQQYSHEDYYFPHLQAYQTLSKSYESQGKHIQALNAFKQFKALEKQNLDKQMAQKMAKQKVQIQKDHQVAMLNNENRLLKTQNELAKERSQNAYLLVILTCWLLGLTIYWLIKNKNTQKTLQILAHTDSLTGICNRHFFTSQAETSISYCQKTQQDVSFIIFDLDHFKKINDNYGHQIGDWALKKAVLAVQGVCRANDIIGRLGGEEFAILLPGCSIEKASQLAEACRKAIANVKSSKSEHQFQLTASFGISHSSQGGYNLDTLFAQADKALYQSKGSGRNKVYTYQEQSFIDSLYTNPAPQ